MKNYLMLFCIFFLGTALHVSAKNYYVAATGSNGNNGLSAATPWQTISKVNASFSAIAAGDSILFKKGDIFYGVLIIGKSGASNKPIVISAYGTGAKPVITGFVKASAWTLVSTGIYQAYIPGAKTTLNMVSLNGVPQALGRYPNATDPNGGYLNYESFSGTTSITDNQLTSTTNWTGAEVAIRKKLWIIDRCKVTAHSATRITYTNPAGATSVGTNGFGYFFQNDPRTLDKLGEWYFKSSTKYLQMYFGTASPSAYTVNVSTLDTLLIINEKNYININNIAFEGANAMTVYGINSNYINIQNCDIRNAGQMGIITTNVSYLLVENTTTNNILSSAMQFNSANGTNTTVRNCTVKNTGTLPGMGQNNSNSYKGILANIKANLMIEYNTIDTTGYTALEFQGSNVTIQNNVINYFCYNKDDGGGIYCWAGGTDAAPGTIYTNRVIKNNIVMNGAGAPYGRNSMNAFVSGIYLDGRPVNIDVINNSVFNVAKNGIASNNPNNINITGNTSYNNLNCMTLTRWAWGNIHNLSIKNNIFYPKTTAQRNFYYTNTAVNEPVVTSFQANVQAIGNIDSNYHSTVNPVGFTFEYYLTTGGAGVADAPRSFEGWKEFSLHDLHSKKPAKEISPYKLNSLVGANKYANGSFTSNISGITPVGVSIAFDNTNKISGGSLKASYALPLAGKYGILHSAVGAVSSAKKYILRVTTLGTTQHGIIRAYIRRTASPYENLVEVQSHSFGTAKTDHEFLFTAPVTTNGSFVIEILQTSGVTYLDNIAFYEATATSLSADDQLRFEYNATKIAKTVALDATYTAVNGTVYTGSVTLQPYTSIILIKNVAPAARPAAGVDTTVTADSTVTFASAADSTAITVKDTVLIAAKSIVATNLGTALKQNIPLTLKAYPNPSADVFNLMLEGGNSNAGVTIMVYTFDGKLVYQTKGNSNNRYSFGSNFMPGIYIVKAVQDNNTQTLKIVKAGN